MSRRNSTALRLARPYVRRRLRRAFDGVFVEGADAVRTSAAREPLLIAANHVCWWDALTILALDASLDTRSHCLMDAENLARLPFFGWVGAVPLDRSSPRASMRDLQQALELVARPSDALWIFPQGRQRPAHLRPLELSPGVAWLARKAGVAVVPLSLNYLFREAPEPAVVASFGRPLPPPGRRSSNATSWLADLERALVSGLERCDRFIVSGAGSFAELVAPRRGASVPVAGRLLAKVAGDAARPAIAPEDGARRA